MRTIVANGSVLDTETMTYRESQDVVIDDGVIVDVDNSGSDSMSEADVVVDATGQFVLPGLIDGHVHFRLATLDFRAMQRWSEVEYGIRMAHLASETLDRGFTTVRDLGGDIKGLTQAISGGVTRGPRIVRAGRMLTQTGGHGDTEGGYREAPTCACDMRSTSFSIVADGVDAVTKAARHNLREGSDFLKVHVSGGVASPSDPLDSVQYTEAELRAVVTEAAHRHTYVAAHAYSPESITLAVECGVHSIEHGNLLDVGSAQTMAAAGSVLVPTLATYQAMSDFGSKFGLPSKNLTKNDQVYSAGLSSLEIARDAGVIMGFGTDLIGETQWMQNQELAIRSQVLSADEILRSMWLTNAKLCGLDGRVGVVSPGAYGDIVVSSIDPVADLTGFADYERSIKQVVQSGKVVTDRTR